MRITLIASLLALVIIACEDHPPICNTRNPTEDLAWLKEEIAQIDTAWSNSVYADYLIIQATYKGNAVFYVSICCPTCNTFPPAIRNCEGEIIGYLGDDIPYVQVDNQATIWKTHNGICD